ncbi:MAG: right-handed parallel beta-helix repeat-containing protein [Candidatus Zixiibacteriota bacterium]|nr:MAG: right-handed parallel beta-helix repeat-containing protein [candidate division Zixibacteria bacterium]
MKVATTYALFFVTIAVVTAKATEIDSGSVSGHWYAAGNPYNINGEITVPLDSTLNIHEGVEVIFQGHYKLIVNGYLEAMGAEGDSILFTASDTSVGWHGIRFINAPDSSHLSYCIIQYGRATGVGPEDPDTWGGGIHCETSNPVITRCSIRLNRAQVFNGGISLYSDANPTITYCDIIHNSANAEAGVGCKNYCDPVLDHCTIAYNISNEHTGGMIMDTYCSPIITNCVFANNSANGSSDNGGGMIIYFYSDPVITNCDFINNSTIQHGGGIRIAGYSNPVINDCLFSGNTAGLSGGGISCTSSNPVFENCTISDNHAGTYGGGFHSINNAQPVLRNCVINDNTALLESGGLEINSGSSAIIINCTVTANEAISQAGGAMTVYSASPEFLNTIVSGNFGNGGVNFISAPNASFRYCDFYNNEGGDFVGAVPSGLGVIDTTNANGDSCDVFMNIFLDPLFEDPSAGNYQITWVNYPAPDSTRSPCIDAGDPDSPLDPDSTTADIGAYYFHQAGYCEYVIGDVNGSDNYNGLDITYGVAYLKGGSPPLYECNCPPYGVWFVSGDVNGSCSLNGLDITYGVAYFKGGPDPIPCPDCPPVR